MIELTNGAQVADTAIIAHVTAEIDGGYVRDRVTVTQYDDKMPVVAVSLMYQNQPYIPPDGAALNVRMRKTDGHGVYNPCLGADADGVVYLAITQQMTAAHGNSTFTVEVSVDGGVKNTPPIGIAINPNPVQEGQIESEDEFLTLQEILAEAEKWGQIVEANAANIQTVVDEMDAIKDAPAAAERAEAAAAEAEKFAAESKGFRTFHGAVVPDANGNLDPSRPMTVGPAVSVEIESAGDRIQSVTALGLTQQAGTGDPSPNNVRALTNGGLRMVKVVFDGTENWVPATSASGAGPAFAVQNVPNPKSGTDEVFASTTQFCTDCPIKNTDGYSGECIWVYGTEQDSGIRARLFGAQSAEQLKTMLAARYASGNPVILWYVTADESQATGLYAPIILTSGEYRAACLELTAPLCEGDSVVSWVKSGCDKQLTLDGSTLTVAASGSNYTVVAANAVAGGTVYASGLAGLSLTAGSITIPGTAFPSSVTSAGQANAWLQSNPQTLYYQSSAYTEAKDKPVSLETHQQSVLVLDGTETYQESVDHASLFYAPAIMQSKTGTAQSNQYKPGGTIWASMPNFSVMNNQTSLGIKDDRFEDAEAFKANVAAQYAAGTPVTIVYQLATPITYAHPAVALEAATGDQLTYTVTGQSGGTVSVALKPFQDGGHAKTAINAKTAENATNAVTAQTAANSQQLGGLSLSGLQNLLVPVGYIFSWAPTSGGPDLSTAQKVAAYFGFGTWQAYGNGQVLVGLDAGQTEFNVPGKTGGEKAHADTVDEMPSHYHTILYDGEAKRPIVDSAVSDNKFGLKFTEGGTAAFRANTGDMQKTGGGQPHNNLQPYITVYRWQRVK